MVKLHVIFTAEKSPKFIITYINIQHFTVVIEQKQKPKGKIEPKETNCMNTLTVKHKIQI